MYDVKFDKIIDKFLLKHKWESIINQFEKAVNKICVNPFNNNLDIKSLKWYKWIFRLRIWNYRFIYEILEKEILIYFVDVWSRGDIYKKYK